MLVYKETGKTKTGELRITRPVGALMIGADQAIADFSNEKITVFIERANGSNHEIATNISLRPFMRLSAFGTSAVRSGLNAAVPFSETLCEIAFDGAISLGEGETIKVSFDGLKPAQTYWVYAMELPIATPYAIKFDRKVVLNEEQSRKFEVAGYDVISIEGFSAIDEATLTFENGQTVKYDRAELVMMAFDVDPFAIVGNDGVISSLDDELIIPLTGVTALDLQKTDGTINLTLRSEYNEY